LIIIFILLVFLTPTFVLAEDHVIINSKDWKDVYSGMIFSNLQKIKNNFLTSTKAGILVLNAISKTDNVRVLSSRKAPYVVGYKSVIESRNFPNVEEKRYTDMNFQLAEELTDIKKFIIIDSSYGYNALSAGPYAVASNSYVLFADSRNINSIVNLLDSRGVEKLILFGQLDRAVKQALQRFNPEIINKGDRFDNNLAIVDEYFKIVNTKQVILTNGEFLEASMLLGDNPVVFIGRANVPQIVKDYIKNSKIEVGVLIGNELVGTATTIRRELGISVFVKFAQGARQPEGAISKVEDLDRFPMPKYDLSLSIQSIVYNKATRSLEVTYKNNVEQAIYFKSTLTIKDGGTTKVTGDEDAIFIDGNNYKTIIYKYDTNGDELNLLGENLSADLFVIFGEGPKSMDYTLEGTFNIDSIEVLDDSQIKIKDLVYDKSKKQFFVTIENTGQVDAFVNVELVDLVVNGEVITVGANKVELIKKGKTIKVPVKIELSEEDFVDNPEIKVRAYYGEREIALIKLTEGTFAFRSQTSNTAIYILVLLVLLVIIGFLGTKKKCKKCGHKNFRGRKTCEKCGHKF